MRCGRWPPFLRSGEDFEHGAFHQFLNAGKKSVTLDLESSRRRNGGAVSWRSPSAPTLIANSAAPVDEAACVAANPKLVLTKIVDDAPELCAVARSGLMSLTGHPDARRSCWAATSRSMAVATYVAVATAAALLARDAPGRGLDHHGLGARIVGDPSWSRRWSSTASPARSPSGAAAGARSPPYSGALPCKDGHWVISQIRPARPLAQIRRVGTRPGAEADPSLAEEENQHKRAT